MVQPFEAIDPAAWAVEERLALLDEMGIWAQILYPNGIGFAVEPRVRHRGRSPAPARPADLQRLPGRDPGGVGRAAAAPGDAAHLGHGPDRQGDDPPPRPGHHAGSRSPTSRSCSACPSCPSPTSTRCGTCSTSPGRWPTSTSGRAAGARTSRRPGRRRRRRRRSCPRRRPAVPSRPWPRPTWRTFGPQRRLRRPWPRQMYMSNVRIIVNLCMSDLFDRYPKLKIVSAESGIGWIPFILEAHGVPARRDGHPPRRGGPPAAPTDRVLPRPPLRHVLVRADRRRRSSSTTSASATCSSRPTSPTRPASTPSPGEHFAKVLGQLEPATRRRVLQDNAAELYGISFA